MVLPDTVDLQVALGQALLAQSQLLHDPAAVVIARDDRHLDAVQLQVFEGEPGQDDEGFGDVALAGELLPDPVTDVGVLERPTLQP